MLEKNVLVAQWRKSTEVYHILEEHFLASGWVTSKGRIMGQIHICPIRANKDNSSSCSCSLRHFKKIYSHEFQLLITIFVVNNAC